MHTGGERVKLLNSALLCMSWSLGKLTIESVDRCNKKSPPSHLRVTARTTM